MKVNNIYEQDGSTNEGCHDQEIKKVAEQPDQRPDFDLTKDLISNCSPLPKGRNQSCELATFIGGGCQKVNKIAYWRFFSIYSLIFFKFIHSFAMYVRVNIILYL